MNDTATEHSEPDRPLGLPLNDQLGQASEARSSLYDLGLSWALAQSFACADNDKKWTADDVAMAFEAGAKAMQAAAGRNMPEPAERLLRYAGQTMRTARSPNLTAREAIAVGNWMAARIGA